MRDRTFNDKVVSWSDEIYSVRETILSLMKASPLMPRSFLSSTRPFLWVTVLLTGNVLEGSRP